MTENLSKKEQSENKSDKVMAIIVAIVALLLLTAIIWLSSRVPDWTQTESTPSFTASSFALTFTPTLSPSLPPINTTTDTPTISLPTPATNTPNNPFIITSTTTPTPIATKTAPFSSPVVGPRVTNAPLLFAVQDWDDYNEGCKDTVVIYGVIISHGKSPYTFTFWSQREPYTTEIAVIKRIASLNNTREYIEFVHPIIVAKGNYKHVELKFIRDDGLETIWIDDIYYSYPDGRICK